MNNIFTEPFSYKLDISLEPNWVAIYKKLSALESENEWEKLIQKKIDLLKEDEERSLFGRRYKFIEYYDSVSGITTRFQRILLNSGKQLFSATDEFGDRGFLVESDSNFSHLQNEKDSFKKREARNKLSVEIGDSYIRNNIFDMYAGGLKSGFQYENEDYLFNFPIRDVFNFLFQLGQRFHGVERNMIIKWPDQIENKFKENNIEYETLFDYAPDELPLEVWDKAFYEKWGGPKVAKISIDSDIPGHWTVLKTNDDTYYDVRLKIFRPGENDRIASQI